MCEAIVYMPIMAPSGHIRGWEALCATPRRRRRLSQIRGFEHDFNLATAVVRQLHARLRDHSHAFVSFNLAPSSFLLPEITKALDELGDLTSSLRWGQVRIELLETEPIEIASLLELGDLLRRAHLALMLDDVGSGYFFQPALVKRLSQELLSHLAGIKFSPAAGQTIGRPNGVWNQLANKWQQSGLDLIVEGIESEPGLTQALRRQLHVQGYAVGRRNINPQNHFMWRLAAQAS